ncbi:sugar phosphate isomerase/epimerase family protein [Spirosoma linguale]|uniref:Xylose isomerase domain protein TIM barrel n=1 Tax=Spirosoma linguale (strain ATCC 33905 / DSM 74 / LMG 10896 / Claus 1) TaxID=504472 RepID=D2QBH9_SPILD|nr:Xylose isomerase domain protein TIM barrel [Spirosoma linguale DSM 74]
MLKRRNFLKNATVLAAAGSSPIASTWSAAAPQQTKKIGVQTYSIRRELKQDMVGSLTALKKIGFSHIELYGYEQQNKKGSVLGYSLKEYRKILSDVGLEPTSSHLEPPLQSIYKFGDGGGTGKGERSIQIEAYTKQNIPAIMEFWKRAIADHQELGIPVMVQPAMPVVNTVDDAKLVCDIFNQTGELAKQANLRWGYHNHSAEFKRIGLKRGEDWSSEMAITPTSYTSEIFYDFLLTHTDPALVFFEMDVYWAVMGQCDPVSYFNRYPGRFPLLHIKDRDILGSTGFMNFASIFEAGYSKGGLERYYVELEYPNPAGSTSLSQLESVKRSYDFVANAGFVK